MCPWFNSRWHHLKTNAKDLGLIFSRKSGLFSKKQFRKQYKISSILKTSLKKIMDTYTYVCISIVCGLLFLRWKFGNRLNIKIHKILQFFNTKYLETYTLYIYLCGTFFFISLGLVRLVSLVSFSKRMKPPGFILFNYRNYHSTTCKRRSPEFYLIFRWTTKIGWGLFHC